MKILYYFINMKNTSRKPYIYKVANLETGQYYIGSQCSGKIVGMNYFTSSTNKAFKEDFKTYGEEKYEITIIKEFEDPKKCVRVENYIIRNHMQLKDGLCLNRACCCNGEKIFSTVGTHHAPWNKGIPCSEEARKKISGVLKGITRSEETRKKMSEAKKSLPTWNKGLPAWNKGIHPSEETRKKQSLAHKGIHHTEDARQKMSIAKKIKISIEGTVFDSLTEAAKYYNVVISTIYCWLKTKKHNAVYIEK